MYDIAALQHESLVAWKKSKVNFKQTGFLRLVEENHAYNYNLWQAEDRARRDDMGFEFVYRAKREIDNFNQQRNDRMEAIDEWLFVELQPAAPSSICPVHSETPGMMIDRLSILTLKAYHMAQQVIRTDVDALHHQTCSSKLDTLEQQKMQLQHCLQQLLQDVLNKTRTFKVYHQFKMYNDPSLNPQLYGQRD